MIKNLATKVVLIAWDTSAGTWKTGDAANLTAYVIKDGASPAALADTSATELDSTNFKGAYVFDVAAGETNATDLIFGGKSSTANIILLSARYTTDDLTKMGVADYGTAQSIASTTLQLAAASPAFGTNVCAGMVVGIYGSTQAYWQFRRVLSNTSGAGGVLTFDATTVTASGTVTYVLFGGAPDAGVATALATIAKLEAAFASSGVFSTAALANSPVGAFRRSSTVTTTGTTSTFTDSTIPETGTNALVGQTILWTGGANSGRSCRVTGSVGTQVTVDPVMPNIITSADAYKLYHDANDLSAAGLRTAVGLASANLDTQLAAIDTVADAVKVKTDQLVFSVAGNVDANMQMINNTTLTGDGETGTEFGVS